MRDYDAYLEADFWDDPLRQPIRRRDFLRLTGGGILFLFTIHVKLPEAEAQRRGYPTDFNAYLRIAPDGRVTCYSGKIEMGQGVITSLAQMLAEELDVDVDSVEMVMGDTALCPWDRGTFGSMSTRFFGPALRRAGAEARRVLIEMAAEKLGLPVDRLDTDRGVIFDRQDPTRRILYGELAQGKRIERRIETEAELKRPEDFEIMGKPLNRRDAVLKVTGKAQFAGDVKLPGMLYARILRPPAHGARLLSVDVRDAEAVPGAIVVRDGDLVAVLHEKPDVAEMALQKIRAQFNVPEPHVDTDTIFEHLLSLKPEGDELSAGGNLVEGARAAQHLVEETYLNDYVAHAPIETHTAVAKIEGDTVTVWASTQTPFPLQGQVARELGIAEEKVRVITPFVGGGFGGKSSNRQAIEAARLAKLTGRPVQVFWTREEEFFFDTFRPAAIVKIRSGIDGKGRICLWDYGVYYAGARGAQHFYDIPHHRTVAYGSGWRGPEGSHPFATGPWRAPANNTNTFARESQIDAMASRINADPVEFHLRNLADERMKRVLRAAAEKFGWKPAPTPSGRGYGVALGTDSGTCVATIAEVEVNRETGSVRVKRVVAAQDMGICVNPEGARLQMEGCITMGLGYALTEYVRFRGGEILDRNFDTYEIPRFSWLPEIETVIVENYELEPQGGGEPAIVTMGAAIANAVYDATGVRMTRLPMTPERLKVALKQKAAG